MAWSTSQLADLAGTTVKAVRHYHQIGLLDEPERASNGYKQYGAIHLVRLLRIKRLTDLGVPLSQIATLGQAEEHPEEALRLLDAELEASIEKLQKVRAELAMILRKQAATDLPAGFSAEGINLTEADRSLMLIYSRVFSSTAMDDLRQMLKDDEPTAADKQFDALEPDADDATRQHLAERFAPQIRATTHKHPWLQNPGEAAPRGMAFAANTVGQALAELYNAAQIDVLVRVNTILEAEKQTES